MTDIFFVKTPVALLDYKFDWSAWLASGETINSAIVTKQGNITLDHQTNDTTSVVAWLAGGDLNSSNIVTCQITTNQGRISERSINVYVQDLL
jgi:hypothetical protein